MGSAMKKATFCLMLAAVFFFALADHAAAEKKEQTYVKKNFRTLTKSVFTVDEGAKHEVTQEIGLGDIEYASSDFRIKEEWTYTQSDLVDGSGTQKGYFLDTHEDGSHDYGTFEGTVQSTSKPDGSWEINWEGTYQYTGGSGKYKNIRGSGKYKGKASSQDPAGHEEGRENVEY